MDDSMRLSTLKEKNAKLAYPTKPVLSETRDLGKMARPPRRAQSARVHEPRQRSSSTSEQPFERKIKDKYANVKPKTMTRVPISARTQDEFSKLNDSKQDVFNDSSSLRQDDLFEQPNTWALRLNRTLDSLFQTANLQRVVPEETARS